MLMLAVADEDKFATWNPVEYELGAALATLMERASKAAKTKRVVIFFTEKPPNEMS
jgi:hypothetical protein